MFGLPDALSFSLPGIEFWRTTALFVVAFGQTLFVLVYMTFPWYRTFLGRALFYKAIMLAVLTDLFVAARYFDFGNKDALFVSVYLLLGIGVWWQFVAFLRVRFNGNQNKANPHKADEFLETDDSVIKEF